MSPLPWEALPGEAPSRREVMVPGLVPVSLV
jgi:hypothetical protein